MAVRDTSDWAVELLSKRTYGKIIELCFQGTYPADPLSRAVFLWAYFTTPEIAEVVSQFCQQCAAHGQPVLKADIIRAGGPSQPDPRRETNSPNPPLE